MIITNFNRTEFLQDYWQKKPCLIKQFAPNFIDPIDENDLAGLAQEEGVDSRIVSKLDGKWNVKQGPFTDFEPYCKGDWSLLVQGVNHYINDVDAMCSLVDFIPNWRFDDVMVSYSTKHAGVGAHTDEYDVFIVQGKGSRRWQVGLPDGGSGRHKQILEHPLLKQIEDIDAVIDEVLLPGDAIYIPPKHPHKGLSLEPCLNYSLGFRAPTNLETLTGILDENDNLEQVQSRYTDPDLSMLRDGQQSSMLVSNRELDKLKSSIIDLLNSPQANSALLQYLSRRGMPSEIAEPAYTVEEIEDAFECGASFEKLPGVKAIYAQARDAKFCFYIDGNLFEVDHSIAAQTKSLLESTQINAIPEEFSQDTTKKGLWLNLVTKLINAGFYLPLD